MTGVGGGKSVVIATRASALALTQTAIVERTLRGLHDGLHVDVLRITTKGDVLLDRPLAALGDKGLFVNELEQAIRERRAHLAVHSAKDLPSSQPPDMRIVAFMKREDPRDVLVSTGGKLADLAAGARVGTSSPRRASQLRSMRPDLEVLDVRGNVDTRLGKLRAGQYDALVLAAAGLLRLGRADEITEWLDPSVMLPAPGQGALAVEVAADDETTSDLCRVMNDHATSIAVRAERAFLRGTGGGCSTATAAFGTVSGDSLHLSGMIGSPGGQIVRDTLAGSAHEPESVGAALASELLDRGGRVLLSTGSTSDAV